MMYLRFAEHFWIWLLEACLSGGFLVVSVWLGPYEVTRIVRPPPRFFGGDYVQPVASFRQYLLTFTRGTTKPSVFPWAGLLQWAWHVRAVGWGVLARPSGFRQGRAVGRRRGNLDQGAAASLCLWDLRCPRLPPPGPYLVAALRRAPWSCWGDVWALHSVRQTRANSEELFLVTMLG